MEIMTDNRFEVKVINENEKILTIRDLSGHPIELHIDGIEIKKVRIFDNESRFNIGIYDTIEGFLYMYNYEFLFNIVTKNMSMTEVINNYIEDIPNLLSIIDNFNEMYTLLSNNMRDEWINTLSLEKSKELKTYQDKFKRLVYGHEGVYLLTDFLMILKVIYNKYSNEVVFNDVIKSLEKLYWEGKHSA